MATQVQGHDVDDELRPVGVAVMTDTDDTGESATAWYDAITLSPRE